MGKYLMSRPRLFKGNGLVLLLNTIIDEDHAWYKVLRERVNPVFLGGVEFKTEVLGMVLLQLLPSVKVLDIKKNTIKDNPLTLKLAKQIVRDYYVYNK